MNGQIELFTVDNPCIGVCRTNKTGYCLGCLRNRQERQQWFEMTEEKKRDVLRLIIGRKKRILQSRQYRREQLEMAFEDDVQNGRLF